jgi:ribonuclease III
MKILEKFNITPKDIKIYEQAFCHSSYVNENNLEKNYERLEFLGDAVLDLIITDYLYNNTDVEEGKMTKLRAIYVCENALYEYASDLGFSEYVKVGHGEELSGGKYRKTILADTFEAFIGAIYLDNGYNKAYEFVYQVIIPYIENNNVSFFNDYKSQLQEIIQTDQKSYEYEVIEETGPSHNKIFTIVVKINNIILGKGTSSSKKEAEQEAAKNALEKMAIIKNDEKDNN